jgi:hypothetical protein
VPDETPLPQQAVNEGVIAYSTVVDVAISAADIVRAILTAARPHLNPGSQYRALDEVTFPDRFHGVPACWIGEDGDAIALTDDLRRGAAAIHALGRQDVSGPVRASTVTLRWARFERTGPTTADWYARTCRQGESGAVRVVIATDVHDYRPRTLHRFTSKEATRG